MVRRGKLIAGLVVAAVAAESLAMPAPVQARGEGGLIAAGIGGLVLGMIAGGAIAQQQRPRYVRVVRPVRPRGPVVSSSTVAVQNALTYYGFYSGPINGQMDRATQEAVRAFQAKVGQQPSGILTADQRRGLLTVYAQRGQNQVASIQDPDPNSIFAVIAGGAGASAAAGIMSAGTANSLPVGGGVPAGGGLAAGNGVASDPLPVRLVPALGQDVYRDRCQSGETRPEPVVLGGRPTLGGAGSLLPGQVCQARLAALVTAKEAFAGMTGIEPATVRAECARISDSLAGLRGALAAETPQSMTRRATREFAATPADQRASAATNFQICLGFGFVDNAPDVVLSSALALIGIGEGGYGEIVGEALALGAGIDPNRARAAAWLESAAAAIDGGGTPVVKAAGIERAEILRLTAAELKSSGPAKPTAVMAALTPREPERSAVPVFGVAAPAPRPEPATAPRLASSAIEPAATPSVALVPAAVAPLPPTPAPITVPVAAQTSPEGRRAAAEAFFTAEQADNKGRLVSLASALGLDPQGLGPICIGQAAALAPPKPEAAVTIRLCRTEAYSRGDRGAMYAYDRALSDLGDQDAESRLTRHLVLGNDRVGPPVHEALAK